MFQPPIAHALSASWLPSLSQAAASQLPCVTHLRSPSVEFTLSLRPKLKVLRGRTEPLSRRQLTARMSLGAVRSTGRSLRFASQVMAAVRCRCAGRAPELRADSPRQARSTKHRGCVVAYFACPSSNALRQFGGVG